MPYVAASAPVANRAGRVLAATTAGWILAAAAMVSVAGPAGASPAAPATAATRAAAAPAGVSALDRRCLNRRRVLCLDKSDRVLRFVEDGRVVRTMSVRFGRPGYRTREGVFRVYRKSRHHWSRLYEVRMPFSMFFSGGQAIHYSADFARVGYANGSHGCANLRTWNGAQWLFDRTPLGTTVVVSR